MRIIFFVAFFCFLSQDLWAQSVAKNDSETKVDFKIKNIGMYVKGNFSKILITSNFNKNNLDESFINVIIDVNSISTNNSKRDKHLLSDDYFDAKAYKQMNLVSTKIEKKTGNNYKLTGKLTIKKITKTITIPLAIDENNQTIIINAHFDLNRRDYGVGRGSWILSNTVKIYVKHVIKK